MERQTLQVVYNDSKIQSVGYNPTKLVFDGVTVKEALNTLADFAVTMCMGWTNTGACIFAVEKLPSTNRPV